MNESRNESGCNEVKYKILKIFSYPFKYYTPEELADMVGISSNAMRQRLSNLFNWKYIWRRQEFRKNGNRYCYRFNKEKGWRVFFELDRRVKLREETGIYVSLNLKKPIPQEVMMTEAYRRLFGSVG